ncbi:MAG: MFS transporter [Clostridia bacterium]|nr:MFS transporter [Clostridia bacterium]
MQTVTEQDIYKTSRFLYILEAAFEYFISLLVAGAYLAKVTSAIGISDSVTGILSSFVSLGCGFQMIAVFLANKRPVKRWVTILHSVNQLAFALIYLVPFISVPQWAKTLFFIGLLLTGHIVNNIVNSPKINWFMSLVDDNKRGRFTANKEIVSLIGGMIFTFIVGQVMDACEAAGNIKAAFIFCGVGIFVLMLLHTATLIFSKEKPVDEKEKKPTKQVLSGLVKDKNLWKVVMVSVLWNVSHYVATPFYGTYQINELGFSMTFVSLLSAGYSILRATCSRPMGKIADKTSFAKMLNICFIVAMVGFAINIFTTPANGKILYTAYYLCYAVAMAGINSGSINLIYDYVDKENRMGAFAFKSAIAGIAGFLTTLACSPLVAYIQANGNTFMGLRVYAQQVTSALAVLLIGVLLIYLNTVVRKMKKHD